MKNMVGTSHLGLFHLTKIIRQAFLIDESNIQLATLGYITVRRRKKHVYKKTKSTEKLM